MVELRDLAFGSWVLHEKYGFVRVTELGEAYIRVTDNRGREDYSAPLDGIPVTPELLEQIGFVKAQDNEFILSYRLANGFYVAFIRSSTGPFKPGDILTNDEYRPIQYLHELQQQYRWRVGEHLKVDL